MGESIHAIKRTHKCGELGPENVGRRVTVMGWVQRSRNLGSLIFTALRDISGIVQITFKAESDSELFLKAQTVKSEYVLAVTGVVAERGPADINPQMKTGRIEILAEELRILSEAETPPIYIEEKSDVYEATRLKYRYLDLRRPDMQRNLVFRHKVSQIVRQYLNENGFLEIETPMLTKSTPEGAKEYLVPSRIHDGKFYSLPQSPQIYKQLLMVAGYDRYYQLARCFRDEDLRADRQPEFTQIDLEMSFVNVDDVISINEGLLARVFDEAMGIKIKTPLRRIPYKEAMERYGSDKPDTRFGLELKDLSQMAERCGFKVFSDAVRQGGSVRAINAAGCAGSFSRKEIDSFAELAKTYGAKGLAWGSFSGKEFKSSITKFLIPDEIQLLKELTDAKDGDLILIAADKDKAVFDALGHLRQEIAQKLNLYDKKTFDLLWVTEFPLFEYSEEEGRLVAKHHPFTSPMDEDLDLLDTDQAKVRAKAYDIVMNGIEIGGGSIRIHDQALQSKMFDLLGFSKEEAQRKFGFLLEAFKYGTPPHGGLAYGLDRMIMLMTGADSIRDVIAFPKVQNASDLMNNAPDYVDDKQLTELHIQKVVKN